MITLTFLAVTGLASAGVIPAPHLVGNVATQYHAQDELGHYSYGYAGGPSAKEEIKTADGVTRGGYTYVDGNGIVQSAAYISDPVNGFRVAASNLPAGPVVPAGPEIAVVAPAANQAVDTSASRVISSVGLQNAPVVTVANPLPSTIIHTSVTPVKIEQVPLAPAVEKPVNEPIAVESVPAPESLPVAESVANINGPKEESNLADAVAIGALPVATIQQLITPVQDTPEVQAAKAAHLAAVAEVKLRDAAQDVQDALENNVNSENERVEEAIEEQSTETTESESSTPEPAAPESPASQSVINNEIRTQLEEVSNPENPIVTPSVVATELVPAASPVSSQVVPSVLAKEVIAAAPAVGPVVVPVAPGIVAAAPAIVVAAPIAPSPSGPVALEHVGQITSQYHSQDELGQYAYGYSGGPSAKHELKTADGLTSGGYSYIDSHGLVQSTAYVSDPVNGFRVEGTNIPKQREPEYIPDSPEVEEAKQQLFKAQAEHIAKL